MNIRSKTESFGAGLALVTWATLGVWGLNMPDAAAQEAVKVDLAAVTRGGRLYDNWLEELKAAEPLMPQPSYPHSGAFANEPKTNWRCKECHGYDYRGNEGAYASGEHFTGIKGIRGMFGAPAEKILSILKDPNHQYGKLLSEQDLSDLAEFVSRGQVDMAKFIKPDRSVAAIDDGQSRELYNIICANCHGDKGQKIVKHRALGYVTRKDPWMAFHQVMNGHPGKSGEMMPALRAFGENSVAGILGYAQTLPGEQSLTSIVRGGRLYGNWYSESGKLPPVRPNPAYPKKSGYAAYAGKTWLCVECHGWDYQGRDGAYGKGSHYTGIKGIRKAAGKDPESIVAVLTDRTHGYAPLLTKAELRDLANFVTDGQVDMGRYIDPQTRLARGDSKKHAAFFTTICARCHGADGAEISNRRPLGKVATSNPQMALHMILNGHPAKEMPALRSLNPGVIADILAYIQTLPKK